VQASSIIEILLPALVRIYRSSKTQHDKARILLQGQGEGWLTDEILKEEKHFFYIDVILEIAYYVRYI
jgi:hypothetical protein